MINQHNAYTANQREQETVRETEAHALLSCAQKLEMARRPECSFEDFQEAVEHNQRLWTVFQGCLVESENPLPKELRATLLNLSVYIDKTSLTALIEKNKDVLQSLIDINRNLAAGLSAKVEGAQIASSIPTPDGEIPTSVMTSV